MFKNWKLNHLLKIKNYKLKIILVFSLLYLLSPTKVEAQSLGLSIYPPLLEVMIQPGKTVSQVYQLTNQSDSDLVMTSSIVPFEPADEFGNTQLIYKGVSFVDWFSFQNADLNLGDNFVLKIGQEQQVVLKIKVPENALEDDYYLTLLFETTAPAKAFGEGGAATRAQAKIGANILLTVSETGEPPRRAQIEQFSLANFQFSIFNFQFIDSFTKPQFILRVKNTGRSLFKPMGTLTVSGWTGGKYLLELLPENILTNSIRQSQCFSTDQNQPFPCRFETNWKNKFLIGHYQAQVNFGLDKISEDYQQTLHFFAFPFVLITILLAIILIFYLVKKYSRLKDNLDNSV